MNNIDIILLNDEQLSDNTQTLLSFLDFLNHTTVTVDKDAFLECMFSFLPEIVNGSKSIDEAMVWLVSETVDFKASFSECVLKTLLLLTIAYLQNVIKLLKEQGITDNEYIQFEFSSLLRNTTIVFKRCRDHI